VSPLRSLFQPVPRLAEFGLLWHAALVVHFYTNRYHTPSWGIATIRVKSRHLAVLGRPDAISAEPAFKRQHAREDAISGMRTMPLPAERRDPSATRSEYTGLLWHPRHESGFVRSKDEKTTQPCEIKSTANAPVARLQAFRVVMRQIGQMAHFYTNRCHTPTTLSK